MDKFQRVRGSRAAYCSHVMHILNKVDKILGKDNPLPDTDVAKLTSHMEQLAQKKEVLQQLNTQIASALHPLYLQADILEQEEIQNTMYITVVKQRVAHLHTP